MQSIMLVALSLAILPARAQEEANWHLFTKSFGGVVSLQHGLTKRVCEFARNRALGLLATEAEQKSMAFKECFSRYMAVAACVNLREREQSGIAHAECFQ